MLLDGRSDILNLEMSDCVWQVGWAIGPANLISALAMVGQWTHFSVPNITQEAVAHGFKQAAQPYEGHVNYFGWLVAEYTRKRDHLAETLRRAGMKPIVPQV